MYPDLYEIVVAKGTPQKLLEEWEERSSRTKDLFQIEFSFQKNAVVVPLHFESRPPLEQYLEESLATYKELNIDYDDTLIEQIKKYYLEYEREELKQLKRSAKELGIEIVSIEKLPYEIEYGVWVNSNSHADIAIRSLRPSLNDALIELKEKIKPNHKYYDYTIGRVYWHQKMKYGYHHKNYGFYLTKPVTVREFIEENRNILEYV